MWQDRGGHETVPQIVAEASVQTNEGPRNGGLGFWHDRGADTWRQVAPQRGISILAGHARAVKRIPPRPPIFKRTFQKLAPLAREGDSLASLDYCRLLWWNYFHHLMPSSCTYRRT